MKVSIITASYNSAKTIGDTLQSVDLQTYKNFEHIIIDGDSFDTTLNIVANFANDSRHFFSEPDDGIYHAMNKGILKASGDIIGFLNADDIFSDKFSLEKIVSEFENPSVNVCFGDLVYVSKNNSKIIRYWKSQHYVAGSFANAWSPAHPTFYIRRTAIERVGCFNLNYPIAADFEFMFRCLNNFQLVSAYIPKVLVRMRVGGVSNSSLKNIIIQNKEILNVLDENYVDYNIIKFFFYKLFNRLCQKIRSYCV